MLTVAGGLVLAGYGASIGASNWAVAHHGPIPVWPGVAAPAGVVFIGLALFLRNLGQDLAGRWAVLAAMAAGVVASYLLADPKLAYASAAAFGLSELADFTVFTWLRRRRLYLAYWAAAGAGLLVDSALFVRLAFGSWDYLTGQAIGKAEATVVVLTGFAAWRKLRGRAA